MDDYAEQERLIETLNRLSDRMDAMVDEAHHKNHITVTHTQQGSIGAWAAAAIACCFVTIIVMLVFIVLENRSYAHLDNQIDQLRAWSDIHSRDIARLQAQKPKE